MSPVPAPGRRVVAVAVVLAAWLVVLLVALLPDSPSANEAQHVAIATLTMASAVVTLLGAVRRGACAAAWLLIGTGLAAYAVGFVIQFWVSGGEHSGPFGLNVSDTTSLLLYPFAYTGLVVLASRRSGRKDRGSLLEGAIVFTGAAGVVLAVARAVYPQLFTGSLAHVVYVLAYPVGGFTLLVICLTAFSFTRGPIDPMWLLLLVGFSLMTLGDGLYGVAAAAGRFHYGTYLDALYTAGPACCALAAMARVPSVSERARPWRSGSLLPTTATLAALGVLVAGCSSPVPPAAVWSAAGCTLLAAVRTKQLFARSRGLDRSRAQARTDELTGLWNRRALLEGVRRSVSLAAPTSEDPVTLLVLDLRGFSEINDSLGHFVGDRVLTEVAERLRTAVGDGLAARLGGAGFAVLADRPRRDAAWADTAAVAGAPPKTINGWVVAARLREAVEQPMLVDGRRLVVTAEVGHAQLVGPTDLTDDDRTVNEVGGSALTDNKRTDSGATEGSAGSIGLVDAADELLRRANVALHHARATHSGSSGWEPSLDLGVRDRLELLGELRAALRDGDGLQAWFQPKADPVKGTVVGLEALVRWLHPVRGLLLPAAFLDTVENAGLLPDLTRLILDQSLAMVRLLLDAGHGIPIAVNLGAPDLLDVRLPDEVRRLLATHGVPARLLRLEVTESVVMSDPDRIIGTLEHLRRLGVGLSLDDYGTGLSSLGYLRLLPVDELKIDRSFVRDLLTDRSSALIVASTIGLAHDLELRVVAEGVEDQATLDALAIAGCDTVQGWHTGRPASPEHTVRALVVPPPRQARTPSGAGAGSGLVEWSP